MEVPGYILWIALAYVAGGEMAAFAAGMAAIIAALGPRGAIPPDEAAAEAAIIFSVLAVPFRGLIEAFWKGRRGRE